MTECCSRPAAGEAASAPRGRHSKISPIAPESGLRASATRRHPQCSVLDSGIIFIHVSRKPQPLSSSCSFSSFLLFYKSAFGRLLVTPARTKGQKRRGNGEVGEKVCKRKKEREIKKNQRLIPTSTLAGQSSDKAFMCRSSGPSTCVGRRNRESKRENQCFHFFPPHSEKLRKRVALHLANKNKICFSS